MPFYHQASNTEIQEGVAFTLNDIQYPANWLNLSSPQDKADNGILELVTAPQPAFNPATQELIPGAITVDGSVATKGWVVRDFTPDELASKARAFQDTVVAAVQAHLDAFARTRNYDGIMSACTYATSTVAKFKTEGQYCVDIRDQTWAALYQWLADIQAGTKPAPTSIADVMAALPTPVWP